MLPWTLAALCLCLGATPLKDLAVLRDFGNHPIMNWWLEGQVQPSHAPGT